MEAILKFNTEDFDENQEFLRCTKATNMAQVLWDIVFNVRRELEAQIEDALDKKVNLSPYDGLDIALYKIESLLEEYNIKPEELIR